MHRFPALFLLAPFVHGEVNNPKETKRIRIDKAALFCHGKAELTECCIDDKTLIGYDEEEISLFSARSLCNFLERLIRIELLKRTLDAFFCILNPCKSLCAVDLYEFHKVIQTAAWNIRIAIDFNTFDHTVVFDNCIEHLEI